MREKPKNVIAADRVHTFEIIQPLLYAMLGEFKDAAKKKPDGALSRKKIEIVNQIVDDALSILEGEASRKYLHRFEEDDFPRNDDVTLMLGQIHSAMKSFSEKYHHWNGIATVWSIKE